MRKEDLDVGVFLEVHGGSVFERGVGDGEKVGNVFGESCPPLATEGGDACGEDFEIGSGKLLSFKS